MINSWSRMIAYAHVLRADQVPKTRKKSLSSQTPSPERLSTWKSSIIKVGSLPITAQVSQICSRWLAAPPTVTHLKLNKSILCPLTWHNTTKVSRLWTPLEARVKTKIAIVVDRADSILRSMRSLMKVIRLHMLYIDLKSAACRCQKPTLKLRKNTIMVLSPNSPTTSATWKSSVSLRKLLATRRKVNTGIRA